MLRRRSRVHGHARGRMQFGRYIDPAQRRGRYTTLLKLVQEVQRVFENDADVVRIIRFLVRSGAVELSGNFAGARVR